MKRITEKYIVENNVKTKTHIIYMWAKKTMQMKRGKSSL